MALPKQPVVARHYAGNDAVSGRYDRAPRYGVIAGHSGAYRLADRLTEGPASEKRRLAALAISACSASDIRAAAMPVKSRPERGHSTSIPTRPVNASAQAMKSAA
jgi:hypothetical protein